MLMVKKAENAKKQEEKNEITPNPTLQNSYVNIFLHILRDYDIYMSERGAFKMKAD